MDAGCLWLANWDSRWVYKSCKIIEFMNPSSATCCPAAATRMCAAQQMTKHRGGLASSEKHISGVLMMVDT